MNQMRCRHPEINGGERWQQTSNRQYPRHGHDAERYGYGGKSSGRMEGKAEYGKRVQRANGVKWGTRRRQGVSLLCAPKVHQMPAGSLEGPRWQSTNREQIEIECPIQACNGRGHDLLSVPRRPLLRKKSLALQWIRRRREIPRWRVTVEGRKPLGWTGIRVLEGVIQGRRLRSANRSVAKP
jgi:hypothetical protein